MNLNYNKDFVLSNKSRIVYNHLIADYYRQKSAWEEDESLLRHAKSLELCLKYWDVDYFRMQSVKDVKRVNCCKDIFCKNCQHNLSLKRFAKYSPILEELTKTNSIFHIVFTVPNCKARELKSVVNKIYKKFPYIIEYFKGKKNNKTFDFKQFGYVGAIKSLEITFHRNGNELEFHPHLHCIFALKKDLDFKKIEYNRFSYSNSNSNVKTFSKFEIFLQKMWYLLYNDMRFSEKNFNSLKVGYSCTSDKCKEGKYHEVFKYAVGGIFKKGFDLDYDTFSTLYNVLYRRKLIQGYGILNKFSFDLDDDEVINEYFEYRKQLEEMEEPVFSVVKLDEIVEDMENNITYISKFRRDYETEVKDEIK